MARQYRYSTRQDQVFFRSSARSPSVPHGTHFTLRPPIETVPRREHPAAWLSTTGIVSLRLRRAHVQVVELAGVSRPTARRIWSTAADLGQVQSDEIRVRNRVHCWMSLAIMVRRGCAGGDVASTATCVDPALDGPYGAGRASSPLFCTGFVRLCQGSRDTFRDPVHKVGVGGRGSVVAPVLIASRQTRLAAARRRTERRMSMHASSHRALDAAPRLRCDHTAESTSERHIFANVGGAERRGGRWHAAPRRSD